MIKFLIQAGMVLVILFIIALVASGMIWVITKLLRFLFPDKFKKSVSPAREKDVM
jgi:hypothetical protein